MLPRRLLSLFSSHWGEATNGGLCDPNEKHNDDACNRILQICQVAGASFAVMHEGKLVAEKSGGRGRRNATDPESPAPDINSMYTMASVSKLFVAICVGLLVHDGLLELDQPISKYVPEFVPKDDSDVRDKATLEDFLRHSSGLDNPVVSLLGPQGKSVVQAEDFMDVLNETPNAWCGRPYFGFWVYSNVAFGLVALVIERVTRMSFSSFVQERILDPLDMKHTAVRSSQLQDNPDSLVHSGAHLSDGSWHGLEHDWTSEENTPVLAMVGIRSSPRDLLVLCSAFLDAQDQDASKPAFELLSNPEANPLRSLKSLLQDSKWVFPGPELNLFNNEMRYHFGIARVEMPSSQTSWGALLHTNGPPNPDSSSNETTAILGEGSGRRLLYKATGISFCGTVSMYIFPESQSGVVVCTNGLNSGDAAHFIATLLIQDLFDLQPKLDVLSWAETEASARVAKFEKDMEEFNEHRDLSKPEKPPDEYVGQYRGFGIAIVVRKSTTGGLEVCFNNKEDMVWPLKHYAEDQYNYGPETRDDWLKHGWLDWDYYLVGILTFQRDQESGQVNGFTWVWENGAEPYLFRKI